MFEKLKWPTGSTVYLLGITSLMAGSTTIVHRKTEYPHVFRISRSHSQDQLILSPEKKVDLHFVINDTVHNMINML